MSGNASLTLNGQMVYTLTWVPSGGNAITDPPPPVVLICYKRQVQTTATSAIFTVGESSVANASCTIGSVTEQVSAQATLSNSPLTVNSPVGADAQWVTQAMGVNSGSATLTFTLSGSLSANVTLIPNGASTTGSAGLSCSVSLAVVGVDLPRFGSPLQALGRGQSNHGSDPTYTRWLPLAFSPSFTSQPFRTKSGALPAPWGNLNCAYSIGLAQESQPPNYDADGISMNYVGSAAGFGAFVLPGTFVPKYAITDANADRLVFDQGWNPYENVQGTLVGGLHNTYSYMNAGPPGQMRQIGHYTYVFQKTSTDPAPIVARLVSISDDLGNTQTLTWGSSNSSDPLLTVTDSSSGRSLIFHPGSGYVGSVDAPEISGATPHTHTALVWDGQGHAQQVNVYTGNGQTLLHQDKFTYGGPNGDSVVTSLQGFTTIANYNGRENLDTKTGENKLDSRRHEKTTFARIQN